MTGQLRADAPFQFYLRSADNGPAPSKVERRGAKAGCWILGDLSGLWAATAAPRRVARSSFESVRLPQIALA